MNNTKTKVENLDVVKLNAFPLDLKKLSELVTNEVVRNVKFNTLKKKVSSLENKVPDATTLIYIN